MSSPTGTEAHSAPRGATAALKAFPAKGKLEKLQNVFEKNFRSITAPVKHDLVSVLLLSWELKDSDMDVSTELRDLASVLSKDYQFDVRQELLKEDERVKRQLDSILADFMYRTDGPHNLGIVYYAGHGFRGEGFGELNLTNNSSQRSRQEDQRLRNTVAWHAAERVFVGSAADILVIFDCCEAGALRASSRASVDHSFEFLGACEKHQYTPGPGRQSFTSALIWALRQLKHSSPCGFDSAELKDKILSAPNADGERLPPVLFPRDFLNFDHVWIYPKVLDQPKPESENASTRVYRENRPPMDYLDLRFRFSKHQNENQVKRLADLLSQFVREQGSSLGVGHVELIEYASMFKDFAQACVKKTRSERRGSRTTICIKNGDDDETVVEAEVVEGDIPGEQRILFRPAVQQLVDQVRARSQQLTMRKVAIIGGSFLAGIICTLFFWHTFFFVPHAQIIQLWEFWGTRGFYPNRPLMLRGPGIYY